MRVDVTPGRWTMCLTLAVVMIGVIGAGGLDAAEPSSGITVTGVGSASQTPTQVIIPAMISGEAPLAGDAIVKYRGAKQQALKALSELKVDGLKIDERGFRMAHATNAQQMMQMMMQGNVQQKMQQKVMVYEEVHIVLNDVGKLKHADLMDTLVKVIDAAKDAGLMTTGRELSYIEMQMSRGTPTSIVSFKIADPSKLHDEAQRKAYEDAKRKAEQLTKLAGLKLGRALAIRETAAAEQQSQNAATSWYGMMLSAAMANDDAADEAGSDTFAKVRQSVQLQVTFETIAE